MNSIKTRAAWPLVDSLRAIVRTWRMRRPHVQSVHTIGFRPARAAIVRMHNDFQRWLIRAELDQIEQDLAHIQLTRDRDNRDEDLAYRRRTRLWSTLRRLEPTFLAPLDTDHND